MKLVVLACMVVLAVAVPRPDKDAEIVHDERSDSGDGNFYYTFETTNGIQEERTGTPGSEGQSNMVGSYSFPLPDGTNAVFTYEADENGVRVSSPLLPPLPDFVIEQIEYARQNPTP